LFNSEPITIYGDGEQTRDFVNVRDVVQANYLAATVAKKSGVVNVGCGDSITINQLAQMMMDLSGNVVPIQYSPTRPADVRHCRADIQKARIELGFNPNSEFLVGLIEYWNWFVEDMRLRSNNIL
jgi:nucleoside-diphosphate-sugar epimerase